MLVRDVMTDKVVTVSPNSSIGVAIGLMRDGGFRRLPVVDEGKLVGIVTDRDLRQATNSPLVLREKWYSDFILEAIKVKACMTPDPVTVTPDTTVLAAVRLMREQKFGGLPVVEDGELVGIITSTDALDYLIQLLEREQAPATPGEQAAAGP